MTEEKITVREGLEKLLDLIAQGKEDWELEFEDRKTGQLIKDIQLVAIKPEGMTVLFG